MLILSRRPDESIRVGEDVTVTVLDVKGHQVRIGISAPRNVAVDRQEIYERKRRNAAHERALHGAAVSRNRVNGNR